MWSHPDYLVHSEVWMDCEVDWWISAALAVMQVCTIAGAKLQVISGCVWKNGIVCATDDVCFLCSASGHNLWVWVWSSDIQRKLGVEPLTHAMPPGHVSVGVSRHFQLGGDLGVDQELPGGIVCPIWRGTPQSLPGEAEKGPWGGRENWVNLLSLQPTHST